MQVCETIEDRDEEDEEFVTVMSEFLKTANEQLEDLRPLCDEGKERLVKACKFFGFSPADCLKVSDTVSQNICDVS